MSYNWTRANQELQGRCKDSRKIGNNTYLHRHDDGTITVRLYSTDIITLYPNGDTELFAGMHQTHTTQSRLNEHLPFTIWSDRACGRSRWVVHIRTAGESKAYNFEDHMVIHADHSVTGAEPFDPEKEKRDRADARAKARAEIREYAAEIAKVMKAAKLGAAKYISFPVDMRNPLSALASVKGWVKGQFMIHPGLRNGKGDWTEGLTLTHWPSGMALWHSSNQAALLTYLERAIPIQDKIGAAAVILKITGEQSRELNREIWEALSGEGVNNRD